jgi:hypothetical protein
VHKLILLVALVLSLSVACGDDGAFGGDGGGSDAGSGDGGGASDAALPEDRDPGAQITVNMASTVGVLLDEFPDEVREEAAKRLLAESDEYFLQRARRQIDYSWYQLMFRQFFYDEGTKMQLPLPPEDAWKVTLVGDPERRTIDGHDVVAIDYDFETTILASADSPRVSEPELARVGGTWQEPFVFPVDPELLLHRTGYACVDESDFPLNSVDGENAWQFYDQTCEVETEETAYCHLTVLPDENCVDAIEKHVGRVETQLAFERVAWDADVAEAVRSGEVTTEAGADLKVFLPGLRNHRVTYRYFPPESCAIAEGCIGAPGWRRLLQFDAISHNVGNGPLHVGDVDYYLEGDGGEVNSHHLYEYSECHGHYHFSHYGSFFYGEDDEAVGGKRAFCLESTNRLSNNETTPLWSPYGFCDYQGIAAGWGDMYQAGLDCQWVDVTDVVSPVTAPLSSHVNPSDLLCEGVPGLDDDGYPKWVATDLKNDDEQPIDTIDCDAVPERMANNRDGVDAELPAPGLGLVTGLCTRGQVGPLRDCGFAPVGDVQNCPAGKGSAVKCRIDVGAAPAVVRVCEASAVLDAGMACTYLDSLANESLLEGMRDVAFPCPAARDADEQGGRFALYAAPLLPGDDPPDVTCTP